MLQGIEGTESLITEREHALVALRQKKFDTRPVPQQIRDIQSRIERRENAERRIMEEEDDVREQIQEREAKLVELEERKQQRRADIETTKAKLREVLAQARRELGDESPPSSERTARQQVVEIAVQSFNHTFTLSANQPANQ